MDKLSNAKTKKIESVAMVIIDEQVKSGIGSRLNIAKVARSCKVSRPWIYKNFGTSNKSIIEASIHFLAPLLVTPTRSQNLWFTKNPAAWEKAFKESLEITRKQVINWPNLFRFYFLIKVSESKYSALIQNYEKRFKTELLSNQLASTQFSNSKKDFITIAELLMAFRLNLILNWLSTDQPNDSELKKSIDEHVPVLSKVFFSKKSILTKE